MGFYYGSSGPPPEKEPGGCRDVFVLTRAVFGVLFWPLAILLGAIVGFAFVLYLFTIFWLLGVLAIAAGLLGLVAYAQWERRHYAGPGSS